MNTPPDDAAPGPNVESDDWLEQAQQEITDKPCPRCNQRGGMTIDWGFLPTGGSLSGSQLKASVVRTLVAKCDCGLVARVTQA